LGERLLYLHSPMQRGDDVAELQRLLSTLGFALGRIDGILGPNTSAALADFQRNSGVAADAICGPETIDTLHRFSAHLGAVTDVSQVLEAESLRHSSQSLQGCRVAIGEQGGLDAAVTAIRRMLVDDGATVLTLHHPDWSSQAEQANRFEADVFIGLQIRPDEPRICFFQSDHSVSRGGQVLAAALGDDLSMVIGAIAPHGMRLPLLRETRMPTVLCRLGDVHALVGHNAEVAGAIQSALRRWVTDRLGEGHDPGPTESD
jgi:N-acetylmuramoyl-L-alanine amidase